MADNTNTGHSANPAATSTPFNETELAYFRDIIVAKRAAALEDVEGLKGQVSDAQEQAENDSAYSSHMADAGTDAMEQEKLFLMIGRQKKYIGYLDRALDRVDDKTYGICKVTGKPISKDRLQAVPHTEISIDAKLQQKK